MIFTTDQIDGIVAAGGGLTLNASTMTFNQLRALAAAASAGKGKLTLKSVSGLTAAQMTDLATLAPGLIAFDLTT